jgi:membrane protease YdiL (CAAX protease family)
VTDSQLGARLSLWERPHLIYLGIAFGFSWLIWITAWLITRNMAPDDQLFNADLVWTLFFDDEPMATIVWLSLLSMLGVYGPMIAGIVATRFDASQSLDDLWQRVGRVRVGARWYGLVIGILVLVAGPAALIVALTTDVRLDAPAAGTVLVFLTVFFVFQMLTSGTEEIGWRGYLNEKLRHGRSFWETGWAVGLPWAAWHIPVVVIMFVNQGMVAVQIIGSLAGFGIGIVAASILHAWFYERTRSVFLNIFIHALFNTIPLSTVLLFQDSPAAVIANLALWAVVIYLKRQHDRPTTLETQSTPAST